MNVIREDRVCITVDTSRDILLIKDDVSKFTETWAVRYGIIKETTPVPSLYDIIYCVVAVQS